MQSFIKSFWIYKHCFLMDRNIFIINWNIAYLENDFGFGKFANFFQKPKRKYASASAYASASVMGTIKIWPKIAPAAVAEWVRAPVQ